MKVFRSAKKLRGKLEMGYPLITIARTRKFLLSGSVRRGFVLRFY